MISSRRQTLSERRRFLRERSFQPKITAQPVRGDERRAFIPLGLCFFGGFIWPSALDTSYMSTKGTTWVKLRCWPPRSRGPVASDSLIPIRVDFTNANRLISDHLSLQVPPFRSCRVENDCVRERGSINLS